MKTLNEYIVEKFAGRYTKNAKIEFNVLLSPHAEERKTRHGDDAFHVISDDEIVETLNRASDKIINDILHDKISVEDRFVVRDNYTQLNIVCQLHDGRERDALRIDVVTIIKTDKFWNTKNNWVVTIN